MKKMYLLLKDSRASMTALTAFLLFIVVGLLAVVIDVGHIFEVKAELQNAADAAALAGARAYFPKNNYPSIIPVVDPPYCYVSGGAVDTAINTASLNKTDYAGVTVLASDVVLGDWDWNNNTFTPYPGACSLALTNAVNVTTRRRADLSQDTVFMGFARFLGYDTVDMSATATAATGFLLSAPEGTPGGFVAPRDDFLRYIWDRTSANPEAPGPMEYTEDSLFYLVMNPAQNNIEPEPPNFGQVDNAGWASGPGDNPTPPYLNNMIDGTGVPFDMVIGQTQIDVTNGVLASTIQHLQTVVGGQDGVAADYVGSTPMHFIVPTVDSNTFSENSIPIQGLWDIEVTNAWKPNQMPPELQEANNISRDVGVIQFRLTGLMGLPGGPGGPPSTAQATIPKLVQ